MGNRREKLIVEQSLIVSKVSGKISTKTITYKKSRELLPKIPTPDSLANSGIKNISLIFSDKNQKYNMVLREMQYDITERSTNQTGQAYSLYFGEDDAEASTYFEGNVVPLEKNKGAMFLSLNVSPKSPENVDLFALPIVVKYNGDILSIIQDIKTVVEDLTKIAKGKRKFIYSKIENLLEDFPEAFQINKNKLGKIADLELLSKVTIMDFNFICCLENSLKLTDCVLSVPDIEEICAECLVLPECLAACFDFLTLPECLVCFSLDVLACAYCVYKAGECTIDAENVFNCCK